MADAPEVTAARAVVLTIPGMPAYSLSPNSRCHWRVKHREIQEAKWAVKAAIWHGGKLHAIPIHGPVRLIWGIHLAKRRKFMDRTNATATLKPFEDALVELGIIDGDTPDIVTDIQIHQLLYKVDHMVAEGEIDVVIESAAQMRREDT
jgi:hypothetical protein